MKIKNKHKSLLSYFLILMILFIWSPKSVYGMDSRLDSLEKVLQNYPEQDTFRRNILNQIIKLVNYKNPAKSKLYNKEMVNLAELLEDETQKGYAFNNLGVHYCMTGDLEIGLQYFLKSLKIQKKLNDKNEQIKTHVNIGGVYYQIQEFDTSLKYLEDAMELNKESGDSITLMHIKQGIANNWISKGDLVSEEQPELAKKYYDKATGYFVEAYNYYKLLGEQNFILSCLNNLAKLSIKKNEFEIALIYLNESLSINNSKVQPLSRASALNKKGEVEFKLENYDQAEYDFLTANKIVEENKIKPTELNITYNLIKLYATIGDYKNFQIHYDKAEELKATLFGEEKMNAIFNAQEKFKSELKEQENIILANKNKLLRSKNILQAWIVGSFLLFLIVGGVGYYRLQNQKRIIKHQNIKLETLNSTKDRLFSIIGHDLRGPASALQGIGTKINYLFKTKQFDRLIEFGNHVEQSVSNLSNLLDNLLYWAIQNKELVKMEAELFNPQEAISENIKLIQNLADKKQLEIVVDIENNLMVYANRQAFQTIFRNLLNNAIKFTPKNGKIELSAMRENQKIKFTLKDNGVGIKKDQISTIFDLKYNKSTSDTSGKVGTGLGLSICKELATINNGEIEVISFENIGSTFILSLPAEKELYKKE